MGSSIVAVRRCVFVAAVLGSLFTSSARAQEPIKIGVVLELSGRFSAFGHTCQTGVKYASEVWGDTVAGRKIEFLHHDDQSDAAATVSTITHLIAQDRINYLIGPLSSPIAAAAIGPWRQGRPVWLVPGGSTTTVEKEVGPDPMFFHTFPYAYHYQKVVAAALKQQLGTPRKVAIIFVDDNYGRTHQPLARKYYTEAGFEIVAEEIVRTNSPDLNPVLTKIARTKPDILLGIGQTTDSVTLAKQVYTRNMKIPYLIGPGSTQLREWQEATGEAQEGWVGIATYLPGLVNWPANKDYPKVLPSTAEWEKRFQDRYGHEPNYHNVTCYVNAIQLLIAIDRVGDDKEKVAAELAKMDIMSPMGSTKFSPTNEGTVNQAFTDLLVFQRRGGKNILLYPPEIATGKIAAAPR
jgi:branched-chain amino acid transport system substrate-binding protein